MTSQKHERQFSATKTNTRSLRNARTSRMRNTENPPRPCCGHGTRRSRCSNNECDSRLGRDLWSGGKTMQNQRIVTPFGLWCRGWHPTGGREHCRCGALHNRLPWAPHELKSGTQTLRRLFDTWNAHAEALGVRAVDPPLPRADQTAL